jgi:hypothetical protein
MVCMHSCFHSYGGGGGRFSLIYALRPRKQHIVFHLRLEAEAEEKVVHSAYNNNSITRWRCSSG